MAIDVDATMWVRVAWPGLAELNQTSRSWLRFEICYKENFDFWFCGKRWLYSIVLVNLQIILRNAIWIDWILVMKLITEFGLIWQLCKNCSMRSWNWEWWRLRLKSNLIRWNQWMKVVTYLTLIKGRGRWIGFRSINWTFNEAIT